MKEFIYSFIILPCIMKSKYSTSTFLMFLSFFILSSFSYAQQAYNLDIIFRKTAWDFYPDLDDFGISLAGGDLNGDGYSDIAIGAAHYIDTLSWWAIDIYVYNGNSNIDTFYDAVIHCPPHFGHNASALCISDIDGDSIGDLIVGDNAGNNAFGEVRIYYGNAPLFDTIVDYTAHGEVSAGDYAMSITSGDINGDGYNDLIVGSPGYGGFNLNGRVYVYYSGPLLDTIPDIILNGKNGEQFGKTVGSGGDLNGDGYEEVAVGADENNEAYFGAGKVSVFFGGNPMDTIPDCWLHGEGVNHFLGGSNVEILNNDSGYARLVTGTMLWPNGFFSINNGKIYALEGSATMDTVVDWRVIGATDSSFLGQWTTSAGTIATQGSDDILSGAPGDFGVGSGYAWLDGSAMDTVPDAFLHGDSGINQQIGWHVASAGDVNTDGRDEVMFSNYAVMGVQPSVWICKYTGPGIGEEGVRKSDPDFRIDLSPNPVLHYLDLQLYCAIGQEPGSIIVYDVSGREVVNLEIAMGTKRYRIDTKGWSLGVYFVQIKRGQCSHVLKVIKIK